MTQLALDFCPHPRIRPVVVRGSTEYTACCSNCRHLNRPRAYPAECCPYRERESAFGVCAGFVLEAP